MILIVLLAAAGLILFTGWKKYGDLFRDRYDMKTRPGALVTKAAPPASLSAFGGDLAVVRSASDDDSTLPGRRA